MENKEEQQEKNLLKIQVKNYIIERLDRHGFVIKKLHKVKNKDTNTYREEYKVEGYYGSLEKIFHKLLQLKIEDNHIETIKCIQNNILKSEVEVTNILKEYKDEIIKDIKKFTNKKEVINV